MFIGRIKSATDNDRIIQDWMVERNNKPKEENIIDTAREEGKEEGREEGIDIGHKSGVKEGIEKKSFEVIKNMLKEKASYEFISKITDKSIKEIKQIEKNIDITLD